MLKSHVATSTTKEWDFQNVQQTRKIKWSMGHATQAVVGQQCGPTISISIVSLRTLTI